MQAQLNERLALVQLYKSLGGDGSSEFAFSTNRRGELIIQSWFVAPQEPVVEHHTA